MLALTSCKNPAGLVAATPGEIDLTSAPTLAPYWDQLPLTSQPDGGWSTYRNDELNLSFQYPTMYDKDKCRKIWLEDKYWREPPTTVIGLWRISITVVEAKDWTGDLASQASQLTSRPEVQPLSAVEPFSIGGLPALRFIYRGRGGPDIQAMPDTDYIKRAYVAFAGRFYEFAYHHLARVTDCDAPLFSEEAVYDHLISTVEFDP